MISLLLAIIYMAFISLGLPDTLLGSAWPIMQVEMSVSIAYAGLVSMIIAGGTIVSSLLSDKLTKMLGTGLVTACSVLMTAVALFGFSFSNEFWMLCLWAIPYGFGAGAVDAALNNYVALHFSSRHMNWLHCCWGVGAAISPYIMSSCLLKGLPWNSGYRTVGMIQIVLTVILFISLPMWNIKKKQGEKEQTVSSNLSFKQLISIKGVKYVLFAFFAYCAFETTAGLWASSYLVLERGITPNKAAQFTSFFYLGITIGRFLSGFISNAVGDRNMIRLGIMIVFVGVVAIFLPISTNSVCLIGLILIGLGCAPIYPAIIHLTPENFGAENSQAIIGLQMASAYTGSTFMPPIFGLIARYITIELFPIFLGVFVVIMMLATEILNKKVKEKE